LNRDILLVDDEPYHIKWIAENLQDDGYQVEYARNVLEALDQIRGKRFRMMLVDLNLPVFGAHVDHALSLGEIYKIFPGLIVAREARNIGYRAKQVVLYSAHKEGAVQAEADILQVEYIIKGNTRHIMTEIEEILAFDPTSD
jgi:CheY-like chemotaxis protein